LLCDEHAIAYIDFSASSSLHALPVTELTDPPPADITRMLHQAVSGDGTARDALFELVYRDLRGLARAKLAHETPLTMLNPTSLVHESWLRLVGNLNTDAQNRRVFFGYASKVMRSVIVDYVRERNAEKRGGGVADVTLLTELAGETVNTEQILAVHEAMTKLKEIDARCHDVVELRYFGGFTVDECAEHLDISAMTVARDWEKARMFLAYELAE
jgi:RNA polymerase sigma factor (TIGR02999 family)